MTGGRSTELTAILSLLRTENVTPSETVSSIMSTCHRDLQAASEKKTDGAESTGDTPGLRHFLSNLWDGILLMAANHCSTHDDLLDIVKSLREWGNGRTEGWRLEGEEVNLRELPLLDAVARTDLDGAVTRLNTQFNENPLLPGEDVPVDNSDDAPYVASMPFTESHWSFIHLNRFLALLWASANVDTCALYGLWAMRSALEYESPDLGDDSKPVAGASDLRVMVAVVWLENAAGNMFRCREIFGPNGNAKWEASNGAPGSGGPRWGGVDGYDPGRWKLWKDVFADIIRDGQSADAVGVAQFAVELMQKAEISTKQ